MRKFKMRTFVLATVAAMVATSALAEDTATPAAPVLSGAINLDFAENGSDKYKGTMGVELDIDASDVATVDLDFKATDGNSLTLDTWTVGTTVNGLDLAFGDNNNLMPETTAAAGATGTLTKPAMTESLMVTSGAASVAIGLSSYTTDITEVSNLQGAYTMDAGIADVTASVDYNRTSKNYVWGGEVSGINAGSLEVGSLLTYDNDANHWAYEGTVDAGNGFTAYVNGDETDMSQNIGGEHVMGFAGAELTSGINYDLDTEDLTPNVSLSFKF